MFPGIYGFAWDSGHIVFLGVFYTVVTTMLVTLGVAAVRAVRDVRAGRADAVRWHEDFGDLPETARRCRHELCGEVARRTCRRGFDCRTCPGHAAGFPGRGSSTGVTAGDAAVAALEVPADRLYHRGHTWVRDEGDGTLTIGLDDLGAHLVGTPDELDLPARGAKVRANGVAWRARKAGVSVRVLAPVDGEVLAVGGPGQGWYLRLRPDGAGADLRHLLTAAEARPWMLRELERLQVALADEGVGPALADGGVPAADLGETLSEREFSEACGAVFLEP